MIGPVSPAEYGEGWLSDADLEAARRAYERFVGDGALANAQLWSLREAIRAEVLAEVRREFGRRGLDLPDE